MVENLFPGLQTAAPMDQGSIIRLLLQLLGGGASGGIGRALPVQPPTALDNLLSFHRQRMAAEAQPMMRPTFAPVENQPTFTPTLQPNFAPVEPQPIFEPTLEPVNTVQPGLRPEPQKQPPTIYRQEPQRGLVGLLRPRMR